MAKLKMWKSMFPLSRDQNMKFPIKNLEQNVPTLERTKFKIKILSKNFEQDVTSLERTIFPFYPRDIFTPLKASN